MPEGMLGRLPLSEVRGPRDALEEKLAGKDGESWLEALRRFLRRENPWEIVKKVFPIWKTVTIGTKKLRTADDFRAALTKAGMRISDWANEILGKPAFTVATEEMSLDLVRVSVAELGFPKGATRKDIYDRAMELGLDLCPAEVGPQLRLQDPDQPKGEWSRVAMEPITDSDGNLSVWSVVRGDDGRWLRGRSGLPDHFWSADGCWVFVRRK